MTGQVYSQTEKKGNTDSTTTQQKKQKKTPSQKKKIEWLSFKEAVRKCQQNPKKLLIDIYTDWCGWCKKMDRGTYSHPKVVQYINKEYYPVKLDAERRDTIVLGKDTLTHKKGMGRNGTHELAAKLMNGRLSYPTTVFLDEQLQMIQPVPGYRGPKSMLLILRYFGENKHHQMKFKEFKKQTDL